MITYPELEKCCIECGLVLEKSFEIEPIKLSEENLEVKYKLLDIIFAMNIYEGILERSLAKFEENKSDLKDFKTDEQIVYALYRSLIDDNCPRNITELCFYGHIREQSILKMDEKMQVSSNCETENVCEKLCGELDINFDQKKTN